MTAIAPHSKRASLGFMDLSFEPIFLLTCVTLFAGFIDSVAGGGGLITLPSLMLAGVPGQFAFGTNKISGCMGTAVAVFNFARNKKIDWSLVALGLAFTFVGAALGAHTILGMNEKDIANMVLILLPIAALPLLSKRSAKGEIKAPSAVPHYKLKAAGICFCVGFYDGFFGPGTGTFLALGFFYFLHQGLVEASANAKAFNLASNLASVSMFLYYQKILFAVAIPMAIASMIGNYIGSHFAIKKGGPFIRRALFVALCLLFGTLTLPHLTTIMATIGWS